MHTLFEVLTTSTIINVYEYKVDNQEQKVSMTLYQKSILRRLIRFCVLKWKRYIIIDSISKHN